MRGLRGDPAIGKSVRAPRRRGDAAATPDALADRLEELVDALAHRLAEGSDPSAAAAIRDHVEALACVASSLRSMALVFDANRADAVAKREEELKAIAVTIGESIRGLAEVDRVFSEQMGGEIQELSELVALSPGTEMASRLRKAVGHVKGAAHQMGDQVRAAAANVAMANLRITTLEQELNEARDRALHDGLTRLYSRTALDQRLLAAVAQRDTGQPWCFLIGDVDHFKRVNDEFGHVAGDGLLAKLARLLEDSLRREDEIGFLARYGGEEFGILLPRTSLELAAKVGERIRAAIAAASWEIAAGGEPHTVRLTISIGVAQHRPSDTPETLIQRADAALYRAKQAGRDRVVLAAEA
jgi:diguanylate cyclase